LRSRASQSERDDRSCHPSDRKWHGHDACHEQR
jgi:hypothetical protein